MSIFASAEIANAQVVSFPGSTKQVRSPNGRADIFYVDPGENADGLHLYSLRLRAESGRIDIIRTFWRSVDVSWSPSGKFFYVNDYVGSTFIDCLAVRPGPLRTTGRSISAVLLRKHLLGVARKADADHLSVYCGHWASPEEMAVEVEGDKFPREFKRRFTYDVRTHDIRDAGM